MRHQSDEMAGYTDVKLNIELFVVQETPLFTMPVGTIGMDYQAALRQHFGNINVILNRDCLPSAFASPELAMAVSVSF